MSSSRISPLVRRVIRALLGSDEPVFVAAAAAATLVLGHALVLAADRSMPLWQAARDALAVSLFLMPFFFLGVQRAAWSLPRWVALPTITAAGLAAVLGHRLVAAGVTHPLLKAGLPLALVLATFLIARWLVKRNAMRAGE
jgi:hypothetical protein